MRLRRKFRVTVSKGEGKNIQGNSYFPHPSTRKKYFPDLKKKKGRGLKKKKKTLTKTNNNSSIILWLVMKNVYISPQLLNSCLSRDKCKKNIIQEVNGLCSKKKREVYIKGVHKIEGL